MNNLDWATYFCRLADFIMANFRKDPNLVNIAGEVICLHEGNFKSINQLLSDCVDHQWNRLSYEAWVMETANRIKKLILILEPTYAEALLTAGGKEFLIDASNVDAARAIREIRQSLQGGRQ